MRIVETLKMRGQNPGSSIQRSSRPGSYGEAVVRVGLLLNAFPHLRLPRVVLDSLASKQ
jgi:hypothetical protein